MQSRGRAPPQGILLRSSTLFVLAVALFSLLGLAWNQFARLDDLAEELDQTREQVAETLMLTTRSVETMMQDLRATTSEVVELEKRVPAHGPESKRATAEVDECRGTRNAEEDSLEEARRQASLEALQNKAREDEARKERERQREADSRMANAAKVEAAARKAAAQAVADVLAAAKKKAVEAAAAKKFHQEAAARKVEEAAAAQEKAEMLAAASEKKKRAEAARRAEAAAAQQRVDEADAAEVLAAAQKKTRDEAAAAKSAADAAAARTEAAQKKAEENERVAFLKAEAKRESDAAAARKMKAAEKAREEHVKRKADAAAVRTAAAAAQKKAGEKALAEHVEREREANRREKTRKEEGWKSRDDRPGPGFQKKEGGAPRMFAKEDKPKADKDKRPPTFGEKLFAAANAALSFCAFRLVPLIAGCYLMKGAWVYIKPGWNYVSSMRMWYN